MKNNMRSWLERLSVIVAITSILTVGAASTSVQGFSSVHDADEDIGSGSKTYYAHRSAQKNILYLYYGDSMSYYSWDYLFDAMGFNCTAAKTSSILLLNLTEFDLVVIGNDTADGWVSSAFFMPIKYSNLPVIGIGYGGCDYFGAHDMKIGWMYSERRSSAQKITPENPTTEIYTTPNNISIGHDGNISIHKTPSHAKMHKESAGNVTCLARYSEERDLYAIAMEEDVNTKRSILWGFFTEKPSMLTPEGKDLLENLCWFAINGNPLVSEPGAGYAFIIIGGVIFMAAITLLRHCVRQDECK